MGVGREGKGGDAVIFLSLSGMRWITARTAKRTNGERCKGELTVPTIDT